jgi:hypothetical protein
MAKPWMMEIYSQSCSFGIQIRKDRGLAFAHHIVYFSLKLNFKRTLINALTKAHKISLGYLKESGF